MAERPVFITAKNRPFYAIFNAEFTWSGGFAVSQSRKNIAEMHSRFASRFPGKKALEISSKSVDQLGVDASAFNLMKYVPSIGKSVPVECVYQSSKVFSNGGPFTELLEATPLEAKRFPGLTSSGSLKCFRFEGRDHPLTNAVGFYDYLYISALAENPELAEQLLEYDGFTDIAFNPNRQYNCQARSAALFVSLHRQGLLEEAKDFDSFMSLIYGIRPLTNSASADDKQPEEEKPAVDDSPTIEVGDVILHGKFGKGTVTEIVSAGLKINFESVGEKTLGEQWVKQNCTVEKRS